MHFLVHVVLPLLGLQDAQHPQAVLFGEAGESLVLKSEGRYGEAYQSLIKALEQRFAGGILNPTDAAEAEFLLSIGNNLAFKLPAHALFAETLGKIAEQPASKNSAIARSWLAFYQSVHLFRAGQIGQAGQVMDQLGYVRDFQVIGPLDNERGSGFLKSFDIEKAPQQAIDLEKSIPGKKRPVRFRRVMLAFVPRAVLDLGARFRPSTQVLAHALFVVESATSQMATLRLSSTGSFAVWVNGKECYRRDIQERELGHDQDICPLALAKGKNLIVVKLCTQGGKFQARMRLTKADGSPLPATTKITANTEDVKSLGKGLSAQDFDKSTPVAKGAVAWLTKRIEKEEGKQARGVLAFKLAWLLAMRGEDEASGRRDLRYAALASELLPDFGPSHHLHAFTLIKASSSQADREENARRRAYSRAVSAWPRNAEAMRALSQMERDDRGNLDKAEAWLKRALAVNPEYGNAIVQTLSCLDERNLDTAREVLLLSYLKDEKTAKHPGILIEAVDLMEARDDLGQAIDLERRILAQSFSLRTLSKLTRLEMKRGNKEAAAAYAKRATEAFPQERSAWSFLAYLHRAGGDLAQAGQTWQQWLEFCPEDDGVQLALARLAALTGNRERQVQALTRALELNPRLKETARKLEYLKAGTKPFYAGYEIDAKKALEQDEGPDSDAKAKGDSHYYLFKQTVIHAYRDGTTSRYEHFMARILNEEGVNVFDVYEPPFYRGDQSARILEAKVTRANGRVERARLGRAYYVDLPPLKVGDVVEIAARIDDRSRSFFGDYFGLQHLFRADEPMPVRKSRLDLILEAGRNYHFQKVGAVPDPKEESLADGSRLLRYELTNIPRREREEMAPSILEEGPLLRVSTYGSWDEFASWWWNLIRKQTIATPAIKKKVQELTAGESDLEAKIRAIYNWIVTDIRYKAWEFGVHGYKPYSVGSIFARRHGDCKDKAILMNSMLAEIGIKSYPVLIRGENQRDKDDLTLAMVEHFNHCISYMPAQQGLRAKFMDGTADYHTIDTLPAMDRGAKVLLVQDGKGKVLDIPWTNADENSNIFVYRVKIHRNGDAQVEVTHSPLQNFAPSIRSRYGNEQGKRRERLSDRLASIFGKVEILDMQFSNLENLNEPAVYRVKFNVKNFVAKEGEKFRVKTAFRLARLSSLTALAQRKTDLLLNTPRSHDVTIIYEAPDGYEWEDIGKDDSYVTTNGKFQLSIKQEGRTVTVHRQRAFSKQRINPESYSAFRELVQRIEAAQKRELILRPSR